MSVINKERIARNTLMLYFRMFLIMAINLYAVRLVLSILGESDYGIYNVVGGVVTMFTFISGTMAGASQRFFSFEIGQNNQTRLKQLFSINVIIYIGIIIIVLFLAETVGLWFLNTKMTIPNDRMFAANMVYQFAIISFLITIISIPYTASITAHEKMSYYANISIIEVVLRLLILFVLLRVNWDKLILYSLLMTIVSFVVSACYYIFCKIKFPESRFKLYWDKKMFNEVIGYSGWTMFGSLATVVRSQGINILLNLFFDTLVNAARGVAYQVFAAVTQFANNFFTAVRPQIVKAYSVGERTAMNNLIFQSSRFSYYLLLFIALPILFETDFIMQLWLKNVPAYVVLFTRLVVINALIESLSNPLIAAVQATGKVKIYQIIVGTILLLNLPISALFLINGYPPQVTFYIAIIISLFAHCVRVFLVQKLVEISINQYLKKVILFCILVTLCSLIFPTLFYIIMPSTTSRFIIQLFASTLSVIISIYTIGMTQHERKTLKEYIILKFKKLRK